MMTPKELGELAVLERASPRVDQDDLPDEEEDMLLEPGLESPQECRVRRYEVQRKLYLAKLLIQIDNTRMIQDGPRHRAYLIDLLERELFSYLTEVRNEVASYAPDPAVDLVAGANGPLEETWGDHKPLDEYQVKVQRLLA